jgi:hypothetical protein
MSRRDLLNACGKLGIRTDHVANGKRGSKDNNWLRIDIVERCYGPGLQWDWNSAAEADAVCARAAAVCRGELGYGLSISQHLLKCGNDELTEYKRLRTLKRRRRDDEAKLLRSAGQWFEMARIAQQLHTMESTVKENCHST